MEENLEKREEMNAGFPGGQSRQMTMIGDGEVPCLKKCPDLFVCQG